MLQTQTPEAAVVRRSRIVNGSPVFYGWIILCAGTVGMIMTSPGQAYCISLFIEHIITDLGISRSLVSTLFTAGTLAGGLALPMIGQQIDRRGSRQMVVVISIVFGLACIYMGFVGNAIMLFLGFGSIRMLGHGCLGLVSANVINQWWIYRRGTIMAIAGVSMSVLGLGVFPNLVNRLIPAFGWRATFIILGAALILLMAPLGFLFFRDRPEEYGLRPDGIPFREKVAAGRDHFADEDWERPEALRTFAFWILAVGIATIAMLTSALFFHMVSIFADNGLAADIAASVYVPIAIANAVANLSSGMMVGRIPVRFILAVALLLVAVSLLMAQFLRGIQMVFLFGSFMGATMGMMRTVGNVVWATYFGRRHLGGISGTASTVLIAGSAIGPVPLGLARDLLGNYNQALTGLAVLPLFLAFITLFAIRPRRLVRATS